MFKRTWPALLIPLILVSGLIAIGFSNRKGIEQAQKFASTVQGKNLQLDAGFVNGTVNIQSQKIAFTIEKVDVQGSTVRLWGILAIDPPAPSCRLSAVTNIDQSNVQVFWECGGVFTSQNFKNLYINPTPEDYNGYFWSYLIIPTGVRQPQIP